jgi:hypothetical protein
LDFDVLLPIFLVFLCWVVEAFDGFSMFLCGVFDVNVCLMLVAGFFILCSFVYILYIPYVSICVLGVSCVFFFFAGLFAVFSMFLADFLMCAYSFWFCFLWFWYFLFFHAVCLVTDMFSWFLM